MLTSIAGLNVLKRLIIYLGFSFGDLLKLRYVDINMCMVKGGWVLINLVA